MPESDITVVVPRRPRKRRTLAGYITPAESPVPQAAAKAAKMGIIPGALVIHRKVYIPLDGHERWLRERYGVRPAETEQPDDVALALSAAGIEVGQ